MEDDADVEKWVQIESDYLKFKLPGNEDKKGDQSRAARKPLTLHDFKTLYSLRKEDINFLADQIITQEICVKSSKAKRKALFGPALVTLAEAGSRERYIRAMKNEMMCHYRGYHLPSKKPEYVQYPETEWEDFATQSKVGRADLQY